MEDLTTPDRLRRTSTFTSSATTQDNLAFELSPFLPQNNAFYLCKSPFRPINVSYISPLPKPSKQSRLEELLISICDEFNKTGEEPSCLKSAVTPPKSAESTCEGSDSKNVLNVQPSSIKKRHHLSNSERLKLIRQDNRAGIELKMEDRIIRRRKRKSIDQLKMLLNEYKKNPNWNKNTMADVAKLTGLSEAQVYKWSWDQKKKIIEE